MEPSKVARCRNTATGPVRMSEDWEARTGVVALGAEAEQQLPPQVHRHQLALEGPSLPAPKPAGRWILSPELAVSICWRAEAFQSVELDSPEPQSAVRPHHPMEERKRKRER